MRIIKYTPIFFAGLYSLAVVLVMPVLQSKDVASYLYYADFSAEEFFLRLDNGLVYLVFNDPVWLVFNIAVSYVFGGGSASLLFFSFFSAFFFSYFIFNALLLYGNKSFYQLSFVALSLVAPIVISNFVVHLREGVAVGVFLAGFASKDRFRRNFLILISPFVHVALFFLVIGYYIVILVRNLNLTLQARILTVSFGGVLLSASLYILPVLFDGLFRQLSMEQKLGGSGLGQIFFLAMLAVIVYNISKIRILHSPGLIPCILFSVFILAVYILSYSFFYAAARVLQAGMAFVIISFFALKFRGSTFVYMMFLSFILYDWGNRFFDPNLGF